MLHLWQGVRLRTGPLNYLFMHTGEMGAYCLGVFDNGASGTLLGGISFRNILVQYDRRNRRVGFGAASCQEIGARHAPCPPGTHEEGCVPRLCTVQMHFSHILECCADSHSCMRLQIIQSNL